MKEVIGSTQKNDKHKVKYVPIGLVFGAALGAAFNNVAIGTSLGILFGGVIDFLRSYRYKK
jgi:hypothetical protein